MSRELGRKSESGGGDDGRTFCLNSQCEMVSVCGGLGDVEGCCCSSGRMGER